MSKRPSRPKKTVKHTPAQSQNSLRIIGGQWRGRKLPFVSEPGFRPTPDRVRETLFNWLQGWIDGAHCLDLFAGSGALGREALSRGATRATLVVNNKLAIGQLQQHLHKLNAGDRALLIQADALSWLSQQASTSKNNFDLVFLDPPFHRNMLELCCETLDKSGILQPKTLIYIEAEAQLQPLPVPQHWQRLKQKSSGQVTSYLYQRQVSPVDSPINVAVTSQNPE